MSVSHVTVPRHSARRLLTYAWGVSAASLVAVVVLSLLMQERITQFVGDSGLLTIVLLAGCLSFVAEYVDASIGMGYGTTLTPLLLLLGFEPLHVVPAVLMQQLVCGAVASVGHHAWGNVDLRPGRPAFHSAVLLGASGLLGGVIAARVAIEIAPATMKAITGVVVVAMGGIAAMGALGRLNFVFAWWKTGVLGLVAALNKGFMGGGYGPLVTVGQMVTGTDPRNAVAITSAAEVITCAGGLLGYALGARGVDWTLAAGLIVGGAVAALLASPTVRVLSPTKLRWGVAVGCILLGAATVARSWGG